MKYLKESRYFPLQIISDGNQISRKRIGYFRRKSEFSDGIKFPDYTLKCSVPLLDNLNNLNLFVVLYIYIACVLVLDIKYSYKNAPYISRGRGGLEIMGRKRVYSGSLIKDLTTDNKGSNKNIYKHQNTKYKPPN